MALDLAARADDRAALDLDERADARAVPERRELRRAELVVHELDLNTRIWTKDVDGAHRLQLLRPRGDVLERLVPGQLLARLRRAVVHAEQTEYQEIVVTRSTDGDAIGAAEAKARELLAQAEASRELGGDLAHVDARRDPDDDVPAELLGLFDNPLRTNQSLVLHRRFS